MNTKAFSLTYDYRCPFARNAHEHVVTALRSDEPLDVHFSPFVLGVSSENIDLNTTWTDQQPNLMALAASVAVRDRFPERFLDAHIALFDLRHNSGSDLRDDALLRKTLESVEVDADAIYSDLDDGWPYESVRTEHLIAVKEYQVFGVPTFIANGHAAFVRVMSRPKGDASVAVGTVQAILSLLYSHVDINEFKHTTLPR